MQKYGRLSLRSVPLLFYSKLCCFSTPHWLRLRLEERLNFWLLQHLFQMTNAANKIRSLFNKRGSKKFQTVQKGVKPSSFSVTLGKCWILRHQKSKPYFSHKIGHAMWILPLARHQWNPGQVNFCNCYLQQELLWNLEIQN